MGVHTYRKETKAVLMGSVKVADWRKELRHFELSPEAADALLKKVPADDNELGLNGSELLELLQGKGEIANYVVLSGAKEKVARTLAAMTKIAWEYDVPYSVDEVEYAKGDEYFDEFSAAYAVDDKGEMRLPNERDDDANG